MKLIALYGVLQDKLNINLLKISIASLYNTVDEVIILFDTPNNKNDRSLKYFNKKKISIYFSNRKKKTTNSPVAEVLKLGRQHKGTHFIFLDSDEAFTYPLMKNIRKYVSNMKPGEKLVMDWISMWKKFDYYRCDKKSIWSNLSKDFVYCDNLKDKFLNSYLYYSRTPGKLNNNFKHLSREEGAVMHFQFVNWKYYQSKQAWYMLCHSAISNKKNDIDNKNKSLAAINRTHFFTYFENYPSTKKIKFMWQKHINNKFFKEKNKNNIIYWEKKFSLFFKKHDIAKYEQLNIWHISFLKKLFINKIKRNPKANFLNKIIFYLFIIKQIFIQCLTIIK